MNKAYVEESWNSANYANPLFIVHYPDGRTLSTMEKTVAEEHAKQYNKTVLTP